MSLEAIHLYASELHIRHTAILHPRRWRGLVNRYSKESRQKSSSIWTLCRVYKGGIKRGEMSIKFCWRAGVFGVNGAAYVRSFFFFPFLFFATVGMYSTEDEMPVERREECMLDQQQRRKWGDRVALFSFCSSPFSLPLYPSFVLLFPSLLISSLLSFPLFSFRAQTNHRPRLKNKYIYTYKRENKQLHFSKLI